MAAWPIGASETGDRPLVVLCESQPNFPAFLLVAWWEGPDVDDIALACMAGIGLPSHAPYDSSRGLDTAKLALYFV